MTDVSVHVSVRVVWLAANAEAHASRDDRIRLSHLLLGALRLADGMCAPEVALLDLDAAALGELGFAAAALKRAMGLEDAELTALRRSFQHAVRGDGVPQADAPLLHRSARVREVFSESARLAAKAGDGSITAVHLVDALASGGVIEAVKGGQVPADEGGSGPSGPRASARGDEPTHAAPKGALGRDLTALAHESVLRPVVGRDLEIKQLARRLQRATKRNALLIGDAGVGKTAVVEGLAAFCAREDAPASLRSLHIIEVSVGDLIAGTRYRGDLEERVQELVTRLQDDPDLVAFIDEVHLALSRQGDDAPSVGNLLKPVLDGDQVRCIAATTTEEYERHVKQDPAFARRFGRPLVVEEPAADVARLILLAWKGRIEEVHPGLTIPDEAVDAALELAVAHVPDRRLPDKAIDLLDDAATFALLPTIHAPAGGAPSKSGVRLGREHVEAVLKEQHGVDVALAGADSARVAEVLGAELVGQDAAVARISTTLGTSRRSSRPDRPLSVLLFTGPTGVGKTYAAELIAEAMYGSAARLCRLNMNEYAERHEIGRLTGAPPGFIGHERPGALFAFVEGHPEGVILLDEIEKAHPDVRQYFLQVFDNAEALDSRGRRVSFAPYVFIMTSNALAGRSHPIGFAPVGATATSDDEESPRQDLAKLLSPEFVARIDALIPFGELPPESLQDLLDLYVLEAIESLRRSDGIQVEVSEDALGLLRARVVGQSEGARGVRRLVESEITAGAQRSLREQRVAAGHRALLLVVEGALVWG